MPLSRPSRASRVAAFVLLVAAASVGCCPLSAAAAPAGAEPTPAAPPAEIGSTPTNASDDAREPGIVELYPNPTTEGNRGEYLVVALPEPGNWSLSDGYHDARIPANASGRVVLSTAPNRTASIRDGFRRDAESAGPNATDGPAIRRLTDHFPLSASGDRIELRRNGTAVDVAAYDRAREGYRWRADWDEWRPRGYEPRSAKPVRDAAVTPFVLPDSPAVPVEPLRAAEDRLFVAGYTLTSERVADALVAAADRGVRVRVLLEGSPVGGFPARSARLLDRLTAAGVEVRILDGEVERFRFHHPKYAVADDDAVVLTENWKRSGTGGRSNRGWGVRVEGGGGGGNATEAGRNATVADELAALFRGDFGARDARSWREFRADTELHDGGRANGSYPTRFDAPPAPATAEVTVLTAPGNAADRIVARIDAADERVLALAPRVGGPDDRIVRALRRAADRGVDVHLLLSDAWYDREANRNLSESLADEPIAVDLAAGRGRYGKVHAKGLVVDDTAVVGSLNWNPSAETTNREVLLAVENESVAEFYARAYAADWRGGGVHLPLGLLAGFGVALAGAGAVARRWVAFG
ncbi:phospholipase D-like domain-containing protein [Halorubrum tebenquichense]|uniref:Phospholipase D/transphosphatidylase n=1 Tax=Halorubrum tebenquichense DSM 14210 TaxID=1227485 RepID=M0DJ61_9EURY|nr:phospholipase D-like domain-containing protein [Halorubrum tebenquichense]ELZ34209.1 phospholipase D/transphosphatidylase [Halorubrum tebenquichense DSM 14210]